MCAQPTGTYRVDLSSPYGKAVVDELLRVAQERQGARFIETVFAESSAIPRMMIVHEVMGRDCGWLTAATAHKYRERLAARRPAHGAAQQYGGEGERPGDARADGEGAGAHLRRVT